MSFNIKKDSFIKWSLFISAIFLTILFLLAITFLIFDYKFKNKINPRVSIGNINIGGLTTGEAIYRLNKRVDFINQGGIIFSYFNQDTTFFPLITSVEGDLAYQVVDFDIEKSVNEAMQIGRIKTLDKNTFNNIINIFKKRNLKMAVSLENKQIEKFLTDKFFHFSTPAKDAKLEITEQTDGQIKLNIRKEEYGQKLNFEEAINNLQNNLSDLNNDKITLNTNASYPEVLKENCLNIEVKTNKILSRLPIELFYQNKNWPIKKDLLLSWLKLKNNNTEIIVGLDIATTSQYLENIIAPKINIEPIDAKFEIIDGKVKEFQIARDGIILDAETSAREIENTLLNSTSSKIELIINSHKSDLTADKVNELGISEIIGTGHSVFTGSPKNRRHNIAVGAAAVNGTLIKPGEEFSLLKTLGKIDKESGYLQELVIKDNKTVPEYGGGLCQIGTTVFRGTIESGLPVTMRRNHSYRVSYYEPAGTDATIYDPWPDYNFINDTKNHILIQSRIEGDDLYFDFWGTPDGRVATHTYPTIYNIVKPGPTKIIETPDLKPGEKKCTEHAHNGADAYFDYQVTYSKDNPPADFKDKTEITEDDYTKNTRFKSHYVPWQEVCLVGIDKKTGTSTEAIITTE